MSDQDETQEEAQDPVGAQLPAAKDRPAQEDRKDEPTEMQDGGE